MRPLGGAGVRGVNPTWAETLPFSPPGIAADMIEWWRFVRVCDCTWIYVGPIRVLELAFECMRVLLQ